MDKSTRILNILTLLLKGHVVTQHDLNQFTDVSKKSIQRDINTINTFFYENEFWSHSNTRVVYNHQLAGYELKQKTQSKHSLGILSLLIKLQSLTPILHHDIHKFLLSSISSMKVSDKHVLMSTLNQFKIRQELLPGKNLMILQKAIVNKDIVRIELEDKKIVIKPLSILSVKVLNLKFKKDGTCNPVLFQIHTHFWNQFQQQFSIKEVVERSEDYITVWVNCTRFDAYYIAYQLAPHAKILKPQSYIDSFIERLDEIKGIYK